MMAMVNLLSASVNGDRSSVSNVVEDCSMVLPCTNEEVGNGLEFKMGKMLGCCKAWVTAKTPVGSISANRSKDGSEMEFHRAISSVVVARAGGILNNVPPAFGTRTYWAWPPGSSCDPKRREDSHRDVKPNRQKLNYIRTKRATTTK
jgi:hypothetical protein